jgi:hypothetical protein
MGTRIGAFKSKSAQLVIWQNSQGISFEFGKHYKDKHTGEWKKTDKLYADELAQIADMFKRAAIWTENRANMEKSMQDATRASEIVKTVVSKIKE